MRKPAAEATLRPLEMCAEAGSAKERPRCLQTQAMLFAAKGARHIDLASLVTRVALPNTIPQATAKRQGRRTHATIGPHLLLYRWLYDGASDHFGGVDMGGDQLAGR